MVSYIELEDPSIAPVEASGSERESEAWEWLGQLYPNDAPSDLAYDANEMIDAFLAGSGRSDRMAKALERIADEQQYRSGYCQTDITVEPALTAEEAQTVAREALAQQTAPRPQPSGETREIDRTFAGDAVRDLAKQVELSGPHAGMIAIPLWVAKDILALIHPAPVASGGQHSSGEGEAGREAIRKVIHELWQLLDDGETGADGTVTIDQARYQEVSKAMDELEALVPDSAGPFWGRLPRQLFLGPEMTDIRQIALDTLKSGAPGLSEQTREVLAGIIARKASLTTTPVAETAGEAVDEGVARERIEKIIKANVRSYGRGGALTFIGVENAAKVILAAYPSPPVPAQDDDKLYKLIKSAREWLSKPDQSAKIFAMNDLDEALASLAKPSQSND